MQNGTIWGYFRISYNIESSTILMTLIDTRIMACTLLSLSYPPGRTRFSLDVDDTSDGNVKDIRKSLQIGNASGEDFI
jgi:hypothetical protein